MEKQVWKPGALLAPVPPALVTCGSMESPNVLTVAWTGITCTQPPQTYISLRPQRHSAPLIRASGEFVINLATAALVRAADLCGVKSGRDYDKFALAGLTPAPASAVSAPLLAESPLSLECRVQQVIPLGSHDMYLAQIVAADVDASLIDKSGALHLERAQLVCYAHGTYFALGQALGAFGFSVRKKGRRPAHGGPARRKAHG